MASHSLRSEDGLGFGLAVLLHFLVVVALFLQFRWGEQPTFGGDGAISVTLGDGMAEAGGAAALGTPDAMEFVDDPVIEEPVVADEPEPEAKQEATERRSTTTRTNRTQRQQERTQRNSRGSETGQRGGRQETGFGEAFGDGASTGSTAQAKADIKVSIGSQVAQYWNSCRVSGLDIDKLSATVTFSMDRSGRITNIGTPRVRGENPSNAPQVSIFQRCVTRSLRQVGRFSGLPEDRYDLWSSYTFEFVKR